MAILNKIIFFGIILILSINIVSSLQNIAIDVKPVYHIGDEVKFSYLIISDKNETIKYFANVKCNNANEKLLELRETKLQAGIPYNDDYVYGTVDDNYLDDSCNAIVTIIEPYGTSYKKPFNIVAMKSFIFNLKLPKKVFVYGESFDVSYETDVENPVIIAKLTYPDGRVQEIILPKSITASQIGTYELSVTASKEGYKTITKKEQFGVLEKEIGARGLGFQNAAICNADSICNGQENNQNCPQDCPPTKVEIMEVSQLKNIKIYILVVVIIGVIIIIIIIYMVRIMKIKRVRSKNKFIKKRKK